MDQLRDFDSARLEEEKRRLGLVMLVVVGIFGLLLLRLWYMQAVMGAEYRRMSENNRVRIRDIQPCRGLIYDRNGTLLVDNRPCFDLDLVPEEAGDVAEVVRQLAAVTGTPAEQFEASLAEAKGQPGFQPVVLVKDADRDLVAKVEMHCFDLPGVSIEVRPKRDYLFPKLAPHVLGYLGEASGRDLERNDKVLAGDYVGKYGVELARQAVLAGFHGSRRIEVDACGREKRPLGEIKPHYGRSIRLTIDANLQRVAQDGLGRRAGAVVAMDVDTGEVLALASAPGFDPNSFVAGLSPEDWDRLRDNPRHPLHNRALQAAYPPGSTFKIIIALAALQEGVITPQTRILCTGGYSFGGRTYRCWKRAGHGEVDLHRALVESCDVYFYKVGQALGIDRLERYAKAFGLGRPPGLGLGTEAAGTVPGRDWKLQRYNEAWLPGETLSAAIGQGFDTASPMQMAEVVAAVANGGKLVKPRIIAGVEGNDGLIRPVSGPRVVGHLPVSEHNLEIVRQALAGVVAAPDGTGKEARSPLVDIGGKTGTAQVVRLPRGLARNVELPEEWRDHAWFVAFAPVQRPRLAVAVIIEHGGHGGSAAAPVARAVIEEAARRGYFAAEGIPASPPPSPQPPPPAGPGGQPVLAGQMRGAAAATAAASGGEQGG